MLSDTSWEMLGEKLSICVSPVHKFGTDAFLLSDFAFPRRKDLCCDLGTGCGIIPMLWFRGEGGPKKAFAVDIQPKAIEQLTETVKQNGLDDRLIPVLADLKDLSALPAGELDLVTCNPPYKAKGSGILNELDAETIARHEVLCTVEDVCLAAARLLKFGGRLCLCQRPERLADTLCAMRAAKIEPKRLRMVQQRGDSAPWLFLVEGKKGSRSYMQVMPPLLIEGEGGFSREVLDIYQKKDNL